MRVNVRTSIVALAAAVVALQMTPPMAAQQGDLDPQIVRLVGSVSEERLGAIPRSSKASRRATRSRRRLARRAASAPRASGFSTR